MDDGTQDRSLDVTPADTRSDTLTEIERLEFQPTESEQYNVTVPDTESTKRLKVTTERDASGSQPQLRESLPTASTASDTPMEMMSAKFHRTDSEPDNAVATEPTKLSPVTGKDSADGTPPLLLVPPYATMHTPCDSLPITAERLS